MIKIYALGDSNTYGYDPRLGSGGRYPKDVRWTGIIDGTAGFSVDNHGINGAITPSGPRTIQAICDGIRAYEPDVVTVMYGSNDLMNMARPSAEESAANMARFLDSLARELPRILPRILLLSPPAMTMGEWTTAAGVDESKRFGEFYRPVAESAGVSFADTSSLALPMCYDGAHLTAQAHGLMADFTLSAVHKMTA
ncbi:MAG: lysophospholipase [Eubacterium sp.]|nr:lysophospholipase [Eubacterium sp.]